MNFSYHQLFNSPIEFIAVITGVVCVFLITVSKVWKIGPLKVDHVYNWPIGIVSSAAFTYVFWNSKLYLNSLLQVFYVITGFLGWYWWLRGGERNTRLRIGRAGPLAAATVVAGTAVLTVVMWLLEANITSSAAPFWDATVVALSLTAQFVMTRKVLEHWWLWICVDIVGTVLFWSQNLQLTSILYVVYGLICLRGLWTWRAMYNKEVEANLPINVLVTSSLKDQVV